ncbi:MAG: thioredoxin domain-containing protein [Acidobacteria bacterium]|nr:thioredoxin domain-containing protein [Acidobacteriota bacterium]
MAKKVVLFVIGMLALTTVLNCAELKWFKGDLSKALDIAKKENKVVMIDFFTDWCTPCKVLEKQVWQDESSIKEISKLNIIPMKLDAEKEGLNDAKKYTIKAYPTILFLNKDGDELGRRVGFGSKEDVLNAIKKNCKETISIKELKEIYEKEPNNFENAFNLAKKISETQVDEAINIYKKIYENDKENAKGYRDKARIEGLMLEFENLTNCVDGINSLLYTFYRKPKPVDILWNNQPIGFEDVKKSIDYLYKGVALSKSKEIANVLEELTKEFKDSNIDLKDYEFNCNALDSFYNAFNGANWISVQDATIDLMLLFKNNLSAQCLNTIAWHNYQLQKNLEEALLISQKSCEMSNDDPLFLDTQAHILMSLGQKDKAIEIEKKAIEKAKNDEKTAGWAEDFEIGLKSFEKDQLNQLRENVLPQNSKLKRAEDIE